MMAEAGHRLGIKLMVLDPKGDASPAGLVGCKTIAASFKDDANIRELASQCDVVTVEIEHVDCDSLEKLEKEGKYVQPSSATIRLIQDKYLQKVHLRKHGIDTPDFADCPTIEAVRQAGVEFGYPLMLKARKGAYDGRGNAVVEDEASILERFNELGGKELYAERWAPFEKELAVMVAKSARSVASYPVVETVQRNNICHLVLAPARIPADVYKAAMELASAAINTLDGYGIFGVELFQMPGGKIVLNEIAPRPHNSGHYTMEGCTTDQFEQVMYACSYTMHHTPYTMHHTPYLIHHTPYPPTLCTSTSALSSTSRSVALIWQSALVLPTQVATAEDMHRGGGAR
jgi:phosphoribosylaminoimidazole carboxylase